MEIQVISFQCILKNKLGRVLSSTINRDVMTSDTSGSSDMLKGLSEGLQNLRAGERRRISLPAQEAYGFYDVTKVIERPLEDFSGQELTVGDQVYLKSADGKVMTPYRVTHVTEDSVGLDGNHPLAGQDLVFEIEALQVRKATAEEIFESSVSPVPPQKLFH